MDPHLTIHHNPNSISSLVLQPQVCVASIGDATIYRRLPKGVIVQGLCSICTSNHGSVHIVICSFCPGKTLLKTLVTVDNVIKIITDIGTALLVKNAKYTCQANMSTKWALHSTTAQRPQNISLDRALPVKAACQGCRSRHLKCDAKPPRCSRCRKENRECDYARSRRGLIVAHLHHRNEQESGTNRSTPDDSPEDFDMAIDCQ